MIFTELRLKGVFAIDPERFDDHRGYLASVFQSEEFEARGLETHFVQAAVSFNRRKGTLRGIHYQAPPHAQAKIVRCTRGLIYDVVVDLRRGSATHLTWMAVELSATGMRSLYVPPGLGHGFLTLEAEAEVTYLLSGQYHPPSERGLRWDDPVLGITWPFPPTVISERDRGFPLLEKEAPPCA